MTAKSLSLAALLLAASTSAAIAQEETPNPPVEDFEIYEFEFNIIDDILNQPVYAPFRQESTVKESSRPAYVINREQIEAQGYRTVNEALKYFPGVFTDSTAGTRLGAQSLQVTRGANSGSQTLILLDGRPINRFDSGAFDLSSLTTDNVERIELIPGGGSTLFGSNAIGGVLNIVTRVPELNSDVLLEVGTEIGNLGFNKQTIAVSYGLENAAFRLAYNRTVADNDYDYNLSDLGLSGTRENADANIQNLNLQAVTQLGDRHKLRFNGIYASKDIGVPGNVDPNNFFGLTKNADQYSNDWLLSLDLESRLGNGNNSTLNTRIFADFNDTYNQNSDRGSRSEGENSSVGLQIQHNWQLSANQNVSYGFDYRNSSAKYSESDSFYSLNIDEEFDQAAFFGRYALKVIPELELSLGLRQDFNSLADGSFTSPSAGLLWNATDSTSIRGNYARNFRAPTAIDLFYDNPFFLSLPNPDLVPEIGNSFDIGIDQKLGDRALFRLTYFNNTLEDALNYVFNPVTFTARTENLGKVRNQGVEAELTVQLTKVLRGFVNYTMNNSKILENANPTVIGNEVSFAGTDYFNVGLAYENPQGAYVGLFLKHIGDRLTNNANTSSLESYTNVDLRARYPINENVNVTASWENIFDEDFEVFAAYPGVGSRFQIGVNAKFR